VRLNLPNAAADAERKKKVSKTEDRKDRKKEGKQERAMIEPT
jgi:hypothetical protein